MTHPPSRGVSLHTKILLALFLGIACGVGVNLLTPDRLDPEWADRLIRYVMRHDFNAFAWYRIALGVAVLMYFH